MTRLFTSILISLVLIGCSNKGNTINRWIEIEPGLLLGIFKVSSQQPESESDIEILKIDPLHFDINIYTASQYNGQPRNLSKWAEEFDLVAAEVKHACKTDRGDEIGHHRDTGGPAAGLHLLSEVPVDRVGEAPVFVILAA